MQIRAAFVGVIGTFGLREGGVRMIGISVQTALVVVQIRVDSDVDVMPLHHQNWYVVLLPSYFVH